MKNENLYPILEKNPIDDSKKNIMDFSLNELMRNPNTKIISQNGRTTIQYRNENGTVRADVQQFSYGEARKVDITPARTKNDQAVFEQGVIERLKAGYTQTDVALSMGISQSRVSQIKKKHKI